MHQRRIGINIKAQRGEDGVVLAEDPPGTWFYEEDGGDDPRDVGACESEGASLKVCQ